MPFTVMFKIPISRLPLRVNCILHNNGYIKGPNFENLSVLPEHTPAMLLKVFYRNVILNEETAVSFLREHGLLDQPHQAEGVSPMWKRNAGEEATR